MSKKHTCIYVPFRIPVWLLRILISSQHINPLKILHAIIYHSNTILSVRLFCKTVQKSCFYRLAGFFCIIIYKLFFHHPNSPVQKKPTATASNGHSNTVGLNYNHGIWYAKAKSLGNPTHKSIYTCIIPQYIVVVNTNFSKYSLEAIFNNTFL